MMDPNKPQRAEKHRKTAKPVAGSPRRRLIVRCVVLGIVVTLAAIGYLQYGHLLTLENLAEQETQLKDHQRVNPVLVFAVAFAIYIAITGLSLPGAAILTLAYGWFFGIVRGTILVSFASTGGATLAFLFSRFLFHDMIQRRFGERLVTFNDNLRREGAFYLFTLRLIPAVPFFVINAVMGLTPIKTRTYWWVSQIGMLPGTIVYVYAGSRVPNLRTLADEGISTVFAPAQITQITIAFVLVGIFPLIVRQLIKRLAPDHTIGEEA